jgi:uncharacterized spore protein YtfJ
MMMEARELLEAIAAKVREMAKTETIVGEPIVLGDVTLVPVTRVMVGFGGGSGGGDVDAKSDKAQKTAGSGGGGGGGVRVEPAAFIVLQRGEVSIMAVPGKRGALAELIDQVPELVEKLAAQQKAKKEGDETD